MIPYMVGKLAPNLSHLTRGLVKYVPGRDYFRAVSSQNGNKLVTSPPPQSPSGSYAQRRPLLKTSRGWQLTLHSAPLHVHPTYIPLTGVLQAETRQDHLIGDPMSREFLLDFKWIRQIDATGGRTTLTPTGSGCSKRLRSYFLSSLQR